MSAMVTSQNVSASADEPVNEDRAADVVDVFFFRFVFFFDGAGSCVVVAFFALRFVFLDEAFFALRFVFFDDAFFADARFFLARFFFFFFAICQPSSTRESV